MRLGAWWLVPAVALPVGAGALVGALTDRRRLRAATPAWGPPAWAFPAAWAALYAAMGAASFLALRGAPSRGAAAALAALYAAQLALNLAWTPVFVRSPRAALGVLLALLAAAGATAAAFARASWAAGALMLPYVAWLGFALAMNAAAAHRAHPNA